MNAIKKAALVIFLITVVGLLIPQSFTNPVEGASRSSYNAKSFWYYPWGKSVTHKGVDIFANKGTNVFSSTSGLILYSGQLEMGGNVVLILGPKWRLHYYAHLESIQTSSLKWVGKSDIIGTVGTSGNAAGKPPHLHYSILTPIPYVWLMDGDIQGWQKGFYLNPIPFLEAGK